MASNLKGKVKNIGHLGNTKEMRTCSIDIPLMLFQYLLNRMFHACQYYCDKIKRRFYV